MEKLPPICLYCRINLNIYRKLFQFKYVDLEKLNAIINSDEIIMGNHILRLFIFNYSNNIELGSIIIK